MGAIDDAGFCNGLFDSEERSSERQQAIREKTARKEVKKAQRAREKEAPASKNE